MYEKTTDRKCWGGTEINSSSKSVFSYHHFSGEYRPEATTTPVKIITVLELCLKTSTSQIQLVGRDGWCSERDDVLLIFVKPSSWRGLSRMSSFRSDVDSVKRSSWYVNYRVWCWGVSYIQTVLEWINRVVVKLNDLKLSGTRKN